MSIITPRALIPAARAAGAVEMKYYREEMAVTGKADGSPVTLADQEAEAVIMRALAELAPGIPAVGEEAVAAGVIPDVSGGTFFLVDALDGTREFITGGGDFTVNIALMRDFRPVAGIIYAPVADALYFTEGKDAFAVLDGVESKISVRAAPPEGLTVIASRRHRDDEQMAEFLRGKKVEKTLSRSSSLKFCLIAAGEADLYFRPGPTSEWDTAAGEAILSAAGGSVTGMEGKPLVYGKADKRFLNPPFMAFA
jgi:3'(2'), 5'-bisphosphate nucleotidase